MGFVTWGMMCVGLVLFLTVPFSAGTTDPRDVSAINSFYTSLGSPPLLGWIPVGGDPCGEEWQGVSCVFSNITELRLSGMNLGGVLDEGIGGFESLIKLDLSHNQIGGSIPSNLPITMRNFFLSGNQFNGSIPATLSTLTQLTELYLDDNHLSEAIPDSFQQLKSLIDLDLSGNNLSGQLPPSFGNLSSLTTLHLQNNRISGLLDVLQDLPLSDLNVENNILSGPIPAKLLNIPNFRKDGNPFNTTILPSPPLALPPYIAWAPSPLEGSRGPAGAPSSVELPQWAKARKFWTNDRVIWIAVAGLIALVVLVVFLLFVWRCCKRRQVNRNSDRHTSEKLNQINKSEKGNLIIVYPCGRPCKSSLFLYFPSILCVTEKAPYLTVAKEAVMKPVDGYGLESGGMRISSKLQDEQVADVIRVPSSSRTQKNYEINKGGVDVMPVSLRPPLPPPLFPSAEEVSVSPIMPAGVNGGVRSSRGQDSCSMSAFTVASLQQYTNSFAEENFIGEDMLGSVYRAELPDGKILAIKKLDTRASRWKNDAEFLELVSTIYKLRHPNILELVGYCNEHGQRLLVYEYCRNGTLYDALHVDDGIRKKLSWNARVRVALGVARALQFLHEVCQPPIVHKNIRSANILLDDKLAVRVSECGLAPLVSSGSLSEFSGSLFVSYGYAAPEIESGSYTCQSDVYSLGVVMLELLTGRKSFDRSRPLGEQFLVRWAIPQLHDIDALARMVDIALKGVYPVKSLSRFADIISRCVQWEPGFRPPISEIVQDLLHMI
ncbi:Serine-threonine/tyrosine-protein kinase [Theobroma cacao]|nr:Serine-threonine/tyrosine-protein kinase [Theobroma cacao]